MECIVEDVYECNGFDNFICSIGATYAADEVMNAEGKLDYTRLHPILFEFPAYQYLRSGDVVGHCTDAGKKYRDSLV